MIQVANNTCTICSETTLLFESYSKEIVSLLLSNLVYTIHPVPVAWTETINRYQKRTNKTTPHIMQRVFFLKKKLWPTNSFRICHTILHANHHVTPSYTHHPLPPNLMCPGETEISKYTFISATHRARNNIHYHLKLKLWFADKIIWSLR